MEEEANAHFPNEQPLVRENEYRYDDPYQWCPGGLTRSQKGWIQRLRNREQQQEDRAHKERRPKSQIWHAKEKADEVVAASVNMVFILPMTFKAQSGEEIAQDMAQFSLDPMQATFDKPDDKERKHLRPLFQKGYINGKPMTKILVDGEAAVNIMRIPCTGSLG